MAVENFSDIENKNLATPDFANEVTFSSENGLGHLFRV